VLERQVSDCLEHFLSHWTMSDLASLVPVAPPNLRLLTNSVVQFSEEGQSCHALHACTA
jgi:hypothetical protein